MSGLLNAYRSRKLALRLRLGRAQLGRVPEQGAVAVADVPVKVRMSMQVVRSDGTVEDHGVIGEEAKEVPAEYLDELRRQAGG